MSRTRYTKKKEPAREMRTPILLGFKTGETEFRFYQIVGWKVRAEFQVRSDDEKYLCDCVRFKIESKCEHVTAVGSPVCFAKAADKITPWKDAKVLTFVYAEAGSKRGTLDEKIGDFSLLELCQQLNEVEVRTGGLLNSARLLAECRVSEANQIGIAHPDVVKAGKKVTPRVAPVDDGAGEDEELTAAFEEKPEPAPEVTKAAAAWQKIKRPNSNDFYVGKDDWEALQYGLHAGGNVLLVGPSGSGKSEVCYLAAKAADLPIEAFNFGATSEPRLTLIGATHFDKEEGTWFKESRFVGAVKRDRGAVLLDEITRASLDAGNILLPLLDRQGYLPLDEGEDSPVIHRGKRVCMLATANVGMTYTGTTPLDTALKQRFSTVVAMDYPPFDYEVKVVLGRCQGLRAAQATTLVKIATDQRRLARQEEQFSEEISTRMLLAAGEKIGAGMAFQQACLTSVVNFFSAEGGDESERTQVKQIIQKHH